MKTILVLYENNGAGHKRAANLLGSILDGREDCRVVSAAGSELFDDPGVDLINRLWIYLVRKNWITLADVLMNFHLRAWILPILEVMQLAGYHDKLDEIAPDAIVCTADGYAKVLGLYAEERSIPLFIVITEFSTFADLVNPTATHICYFPEIINAVRSYPFEAAYFASRLDRSSTVWEKIKYVFRVCKGHLLAGGSRSIYRNIDRQHPERNQARCVAVGPLVDPAYYARKDKREARTKLGLDAERPCVLTISGSIGGDYLREIVTTLQDARSEPLTLLSVCGRDQASYRRVDAIKRRNPAIEVVPLGFVDRMDELYAAADVVIARPSASVLLEAMMQRVPILVPARATANDLGGAALIKKYRLGGVYEGGPDLVRSLAGILERHPDHVDAISRFLSAYPSEPRALEETLVRLILGELEGRAPAPEEPGRRPHPSA